MRRMAAQHPAYLHPFSWEIVDDDMENKNLLVGLSPDVDVCLTCAQMLHDKVPVLMNQNMNTQYPITWLVKSFKGYPKSRNTIKDSKINQ